MGLIDFPKYITVHKHITKEYPNVTLINYNEQTGEVIITCPECRAKGKVDKGGSSSWGYQPVWRKCETCNGYCTIRFIVGTEVKNPVENPPKRCNSCGTIKPEKGASEEGGNK